MFSHLWGSVIKPHPIKFLLTFIVAVVVFGWLVWWLIRKAAGLLGLLPIVGDKLFTAETQLEAALMPGGTPAAGQPSPVA